MLHRARLLSFLHSEPVSDINNDGSTTSLTSTISVQSGRSFSKKMNSSGRRGKKRVQFSLRSNKMYSSPPIPEDVLEVMWYSKDDYVVFREKATNDIKLNAMETLKSTGTSPYSRAILEVYERCCSVRNRSDNVEITESQRSFLEKFFDDHDCHGLERYCINDIRNDKANRKNCLIETVLAAQQSRFLKAKAGSFDKDRVICENSERQTLAGTQFARILAEVQVTAACY